MSIFNRCVLTGKSNKLLSLQKYYNKKQNNDHEHKMLCVQIMLKRIKIHQVRAVTRNVNPTNANVPVMYRFLVLVHSSHDPHSQCLIKTSIGAISPKFQIPHNYFCQLGCKILQITYFNWSLPKTFQQPGQACGQYCELLSAQSPILHCKLTVLKSAG